jgi:hypothetical protein
MERSTGPVWNPAKVRQAKTLLLFGKKGIIDNMHRPMRISPVAVQEKIQRLWALLTSTPPARTVPDQTGKTRSQWPFPQVFIRR